MELVESRFDDLWAMAPVADNTALFPGDLNRTERFTRPLRVQNALVGIDLVDGKQAAEALEQALKKYI